MQPSYHPQPFPKLFFILFFKFLLAAENDKMDYLVYLLHRSFRKRKVQLLFCMYNLYLI